MPVNLGGPAWRASGWLGIVIAGQLWSSLDDSTTGSFDADIRKIVAQISATVPVDADLEDHPDTNISSEELRAELDRLRQDITETDHAFTFDPSQPAVLSSDVPSLPPAFRETPAIQWLRDTLLQRGDAADCDMVRVGVFGCGGIGKTVTLVRQ